MFDLDCDSKADDTKTILKDKEGTKTFLCPEGCASQNFKVYASKHNKYHFESSICKAAIHSGVLSNMGGEAQL